MELTRDEARRIAVISDFGMHSVVNSALSGQEGPRAMTMRKVIVLGCVLVAIAITLKVKLTTPQGPQPLAPCALHYPLATAPGRFGAALTTADRGEYR